MSLVFKYLITMRWKTLNLDDVHTHACKVSPCSSRTLDGKSIVPLYHMQARLLQYPLNPLDGDISRRYVCLYVHEFTPPLEGRSDNMKGRVVRFSLTCNCPCQNNVQNLCKNLTISPPLLRRKSRRNRRKSFIMVRRHLLRFLNVFRILPYLYKHDFGKFLYQRYRTDFWLTVPK